MYICLISCTGFTVDAKNFVHELIHCRLENWLKVNSVLSLKRREILHVLLFDFIVIDLRREILHVLLFDFYCYRFNCIRYFANNSVTLFRILMLLNMLVVRYKVTKCLS